MTQPKAYVTVPVNLEPVDYRRGLDELKNDLIQAAGFAGYDLDPMTITFEGLEGVA